MLYSTNTFKDILRQSDAQFYHKCLINDKELGDRKSSKAFKDLQKNMKMTYNAVKK